MWAVSVGGTNSDVGLGITSMGSDKVAVTGYFNGETTTFGDVVLSRKMWNDVFIGMVSVSVSLRVINSYNDSDGWK